MVTLHETIHILGFSGGTMQYWLNSATNKEYGDKLNLIVSNETIRGFITTILKSTNVLNTARKYYNCPTLSGMQIEN
jgi:proprotein convertase subtilisin/kexin type 5